MKLGSACSLKSHDDHGRINFLLKDFRKFFKPVFRPKSNRQEVHHSFTGNKSSDGVQPGFMVQGVNKPVQGFIPEIFPQVMEPGFAARSLDQIIFIQEGNCTV